jgi:sarcosine oxidase/L-pipecolate oxidase
LDCEVSEKGIAGLRREYQALIDAGVGDTHEWLDSEDKILAKVPLLPRESIKVRCILPEIVAKSLMRNFQGWNAIYSHDGGWLAAAKAINAIGEFCQKQGVRFGFGG